MCEVVGGIAAFMQLSKYAFSTYHELSRLSRTIRSASELPIEWDIHIRSLGNLVETIEASNTSREGDVHQLVLQCKKKLQIVNGMTSALTTNKAVQGRPKWLHNIRVVSKKQEVTEAIASLLPIVESLYHLSTTMHLLHLTQPTPNKDDQRKTWRRINNLAVTLHASDRLPEAEELFRDALSAFRSSCGHAHPDTLHVTDNLARLLRDRGKYAEAQPLALASALGLESAVGLAHRGTLDAFRNVAIILQWQEEFVAALIFARRVLEGWKELRERDEGIGIEMFETHVVELDSLVRWSDAEAVD